MRRMYSKPQLLEAVEQEAEVNGLKAFENIVDKDGHKRFIEGDVNLVQSLSGFTKLYGKWALSGSHLLIVLACSVEASSTLGDGTKVADVVLPDWILDKIVPLATKTIDIKGYYVYTNDWTVYSKQLGIQKETDYVSIRNISGTATFPSSASTFRIAFDLLIDNE